MSGIRTSLLCTLPLIAAGCPARQQPPASVHTAWQNRDPAPPPPAAYREREPKTGGQSLGESDGRIDAIATVNGAEIPRRRLIELLIRSRGVAVLEQLIGLEAAMQAAEKRGLSVSEDDVRRERDLSLRRLVDPLWPVTPNSYDPTTAEQVLSATLAQRNMSAEEFDILTRRNAYLRELASLDVQINEGELEREFAVHFGPKVEVRHIQITSAADAARLRDRIERGEDFAALAGQYSANTASASEGGRLAPFSLDDSRIPEAFRTATAALKPGDVTGIARAGAWHHVIQLERRIPAVTVSFADVRPDLEEQLRVRLAEDRMYPLFERLFREARISIHNPLLAEEFAKVHTHRTP